MKRVLCIACIVTCCLFGTVALAEDMDVDQRLKKLEDKVQDQQKEIDTLKKDANKQENQDNALQAKEAPSWKVSGLFGASALTNPNISLVLDTFIYSSNLTHTE